MRGAEGSDAPLNPCMLLACIRQLVPDDGPTCDAELREFLPQIDAVLREVRWANQRRNELEAAA